MLFFIKCIGSDHVHAIRIVDISTRAHNKNQLALISSAAITTLGSSAIGFILLSLLKNIININTINMIHSAIFAKVFDIFHIFHRVLSNHINSPKTKSLLSRCPAINAIGNQSIFTIFINSKKILLVVSEAAYADDTNRVMNTNINTIVFFSI